jgi:drug/metabolite transporter (DMT)-like permease
MQSTMTFRRYLVLFVIMVTGSLGDIFLSAGMKQAGPVAVGHLSSLFTALAIPWVLAGIALLVAFFATYLTALSWADLTYVLPATSFGYVIIALLSKFWLHETITAGRWAGILLITAGVGFVTRGPSYTYPAASHLPEDKDLECAAVGQPHEVGKERSA